MANVLCLANILGCKVSSLPMKYLDLPSGATLKAKSIWDGVLEKIERKLAGWNNCLGRRRREGGLRCLSHLLTFSLCPFPAGVASYWEVLLPLFGDKVKLHIICWDKVCSPIAGWFGGA